MSARGSLRGSGEGAMVLALKAVVPMLCVRVLVDKVWLLLLLPLPLLLRAARGNWGCICEEDDEERPLSVDAREVACEVACLCKVPETRFELIRLWAPPRSLRRPTASKAFLCRDLRSISLAPSILDLGTKFPSPSTILGRLLPREWPPPPRAAPR